MLNSKMSRSNSLFSIKLFLPLLSLLAISGCASISSEYCGEGAGFDVSSEGVQFWRSSDINAESYSVKGADYKTFQGIEDPFESNDKCHIEYGRDFEHVFYRGKIIEHADPKTFGYFNWLYVKDANAVYFQNTFLTNRVQQFHMLDSDFYATDGEKAFFQGKVLDGDGFALFPGSPGYAKSKTAVYHAGNLIQDADPATFLTRFDGCSLYSESDKSHVFLDDKPVPGADPKTFVRLACTNIFKDSRAVYFWNKELPSVHPDFAKISEIRNYLFDDVAVYKIGQRTIYGSEGITLLEGRDPATFHELGWPWTKDKNGVYFKDKLLPQADPVTFKSNEKFRSASRNLRGEDKNYRYEDGQPACKFDPGNQEPLPNCDTEFEANAK